MLWHSKHVRLYMEQQARKEWKGHDIDVLYDKTMAILGFGSIGSYCGKVARHGFHTRVIGIDKFEVKDPYVRTCADKIVGMDKLPEVLPEADFFVSVLPQTEETTNLLTNETCFSKMKPSAIFMNIGRGKVVNEEHLVQALIDKRIAGAVLDVTSEEPLSQDSPLWTMPNVLIYPHSADKDPSRLERAVNQF